MIEKIIMHEVINLFYKLIGISNFMLHQRKTFWWSTIWKFQKTRFDKFFDRNEVSNEEISFSNWNVLFILNLILRIEELKKNRWNCKWSLHWLCSVINLPNCLESGLSTFIFEKMAKKLMARSFSDINRTRNFSVLKTWGFRTINFYPHL